MKISELFEEISKYFIKFGELECLIWTINEIWYLSSLTIQFGGNKYGTEK